MSVAIRKPACQWKVELRSPQRKVEKCGAADHARDKLNPWGPAKRLVNCVFK
jgi:hypothetical protein